MAVHKDCYATLGLIRQGGPSPEGDEERFIAIDQTLSAGPYEADIC